MNYGDISVIELCSIINAYFSNIRLRSILGFLLRAISTMALATVVIGSIKIFI